MQPLLPYFRSLWLMLLFSVQLAHGQRPRPARICLKPLAAPAVLLGAGLLAHNENTRAWQRQLRYDRYYGFHTTADDYLRFAPLALWAVAPAVQPPLHTFQERAVTAAVAHGLSLGTTALLKSTVKAERPNYSNFRSFPSGHTAMAFTGAALLAHEYRHVPELAVAGYAFATATGVLRVLNHEHYVSDVLVGAGIGVASVEVAYLLYPVINRHLPVKLRNRQAMLMPTGRGAMLVMRF